MPISSSSSRRCAFQGQKPVRTMTCSFRVMIHVVVMGHRDSCAACFSFISFAKAHQRVGHTDGLSRKSQHNQPDTIHTCTAYVCHHSVLPWIFVGGGDKVNDDAYWYVTSNPKVRSFLFPRRKKLQHKLASECHTMLKKE